MRAQGSLNIKNTTVRARIDNKLKNEVTGILNELGMTPSEAINMLFHQIKNYKGLPFDVRIPNNETLQAMTDARGGKDLTASKDADDMFRKLGI